MQGKPRKVRCFHNGAEHVGTFEIQGRYLILTCAHGTRRAILGLMNERRLAQRLFRNLVVKAEGEIEAVVPPPAVIEAVQDAGLPVQAGAGPGLP